MSEISKARGNGIGFGSVLGLIFITLKLIGVIDWSWWWVLSPFWMPLAIVVAFSSVVILLTLAKK